MNRKYWLIMVLCLVLTGTLCSSSFSSRAYAEEEHGETHVPEAAHGVEHDTRAGSVKDKVELRGIKDSITPFLPILVILISIFFIPFVDEKTGDRITAYSNLATLLTTLLMLPDVWNGYTLQAVFNTGFNVEVAFMADGLSLLAALISIIVWTLASFYSVEYMSHSKNRARYNIFSLLTLIGMMGVVLSRNLFSLYIFFEMLSVCSYVMVVHEQTEEALNAGRKYLFMGIIGGLILLFSIISVYVIAGTGDLVEISRMGLGVADHWALPFIFLGFIIGFGVKAGLFPLHIWLPDAHPVAPAPASALLSGVMIKAGGYGIIRVLYTINGLEIMQNHYLTTFVMLLAFTNIFLGSAMAIAQTEIKRMLAYSSISQIGYVIFGAAIMTPLGVIGGAVHIFNHALIKAILFLSAGAFIHQVGLRNLEDLQGIGKKMPITTACFTIGGISMIGLPPMNGFISKWFLVLGGMEHARAASSGLNWGIIGILMLLLSSFMNLLYYGPIIYRAWFLPPSPALEAKNIDNADGNKWMSIPLLCLGALIIIFGVFPLLPVHLAHLFSAGVFPH